MKKAIPFMLAVVSCMAAITAFSQNTSQNDEKNKTKKIKMVTTNNDDAEHTTVSKVINIDDDGQKHMTVTTTKNGETEVEEYVGEEVEKYLEEHGNIMGCQMNKFMWKSDGEDMEMDIDIDVDELMKKTGVEITEGENGEKKVIVKSCHGNSFNYNTNVSSDDKHKVMVKAMCMDTDNDKDVAVLKKKQVYDDVENLEELLEELGVEVQDDQLLDSKRKKRVVVKKIVRIENIDESEEAEVVEEESKMDKAQGFNVYPNPSTGEFTLDFNSTSTEPTMVVVTDSNGKTVYKKKVKGEGEQRLTIDLGKKSKGVYLVTLNQGNETNTQKIMVE